MGPRTHARRRGTRAMLAAALGIALLAACSSSPDPSPSGTSTAPGGSPTPSTPSSSATPSMSVTSSSSASSSSGTSATATSTPSTSDLSGFSIGPVEGGTPVAAPPLVTLVRVDAGSHDGYDRLVLDFGTDPVPEFLVTTQRTPVFEPDPGGDNVRLEGTAGVRVAVRGVQLAPTAVTDDMVPRYPAIREVRQVGNFEAVLTYALGVRGQPALVRVTTLTSPNRLVIDVRWPA